MVKFFPLKQTAQDAPLTRVFVITGFGWDQFVSLLQDLLNLRKDQRQMSTLLVQQVCRCWAFLRFRIAASQILHDN